MPTLPALLRRAAFCGGLLALCAASWGQAAAVLDGHDLSFDGGLVRSFPPALGELRGPVTQGNTVWLGIGPEVYGFDARGQVQTRLDFSGPISALDGGAGTGADLLTVTAGYPGAQDTYTVSDGQIRERVVFAPLPEVTTWLERAAALATPAQVRAAEQTDPTNPFLALRHAQQARAQGDNFTALSEMQRAAGLDLPFPAAVRLAAQMEDQGAPSAANLLLARAGRDSMARGYDPALPLSRSALRAYGDPLAEVNRLLSQGRLERAEVWLRYLRQVSPRFEQASAVYGRYAALLDAQGRGGEAQEWRDFARSLNAGTLYNLGPTALVDIQGAARLLSGALLLSVLCAWLALLVRCWPQQGQDSAALGGRWRSWQRPLWRLRRSVLGYAGLGEKLVMVTLLLGLLLGLCAWSWAARSQAALQAPALNMGTYGGGWFYDHLGDLQVNRDADLLRGLAAQLDGDETQARRYYQAQQGAEERRRVGRSVTEACIQNNLGVLAQEQGDPAGARELWRSALQIAPDQTSAALNLGLRRNAEPYRSGGPWLCYPDQRSTISALGGSLRGDLGGLVRAPLAHLLATPTGWPRAWQWVWATALLLACAYSLIMLLVPAAAPLTGQAPRKVGGGGAHSALGGNLGGLPRSLPFRALALLLPGTALLDSSWGALLLLAWSGTLLGWLTGWPPLAARGPFTLLLMVLFYVINFVALALTQFRYWRRLRHYA